MTMRRILATAVLFLFACDDADGGKLSAASPNNAGDSDSDTDGDDSAAYDPPNDDLTIGAVNDAGTTPPPPPASSDAGADAGITRADSPVPGKVVTYPFGVKNARYAAGYHTGDD